MEKCDLMMGKIIIELNDYVKESNRLLPIDVFLFKEMQDFRHCLRTFVLKETEVLFGPVTSMQNILKKRNQRRTVQLVKKVD